LECLKSRQTRLIRALYNRRTTQVQTKYLFLLQIAAAAGIGATLDGAKSSSRHQPDQRPLAADSRSRLRGSPATSGLIATTCGAS
jgi:hypothetical protein